MKQLISFVLVCSMILLSAVTIFASDTAECYDLIEVFTDYDEKTVGEMVGFIADNQKVYMLLEYFRDKSFGRTGMIYFHLAGEKKPGADGVPSLPSVGIVDYTGKYMISTSRVVRPSSFFDGGDYRIGDVGNRIMSVELNLSFMDYVNSLNRLDGNLIIMNLLLNVLSNEEVVGISWSNNDYVLGGGAGGTSLAPYSIGDCNADNAINPIDSYLLKGIISGRNTKADPFAVDMNGDGQINAKDSLILKMKLVNG